LRPPTKILLLASRITFSLCQNLPPANHKLGNLADRAYTTKPTFGLPATWIDAGIKEDGLSSSR